MDFPLPQLGLIFQNLSSIHSPFTAWRLCFWYPLFVCWSVCLLATLLKKLWRGCDEILCRIPGGKKNKVTTFWFWLIGSGSGFGGGLCSPCVWNVMTVCGYFVATHRHWMADSPNCKYELPCLRSVLLSCSYFLFYSYVYFSFTALHYLHNIMFNKASTMRSKQHIILLINVTCCCRWLHHLDKPAWCWQMELLADTTRSVIHVYLSAI